MKKKKPFSSSPDFRVHLEISFTRATPLLHMTVCGVRINEIITALTSHTYTHPRTRGLARKKRNGLKVYNIRAAGKRRFCYVFYPSCCRMNNDYRCPV